MKKRTILIAHNYTRDTFAAMTTYLAESLAEDGHQVIFLSHRPYFKKPLYKKIGKGELIVYSWASKKRPTGIKDMVFFSKLYFKYKPQIVLGHFVGANISISMSKIFSFGKVKTIGYYHTMSKALEFDENFTVLKKIIKRFKIERKKLYLKLVDKIICPSKMAQEDITSFFGVSKRKTIIIPNSIVDRFNQNTKKAVAKNLLGYLGRLDPTKNIIKLLEAIIKYNERNKEKIILEMAGAGQLSKFVEEKANQLEYIKYVGKIPYREVDNFIKINYFMIIPSLSDNLPTVGLESLMNGTPLLLSNQTGLAEFCSDGKDSFIFTPDEQGIYSALEKMSQVKDYEQMSKNARETYKKYFSMESYIKKMKKILLEE